MHYLANHAPGGGKVVTRRVHQVPGTKEGVQDLKERNQIAARQFHCHNRVSKAEGGINRGTAGKVSDEGSMVEISEVVPQCQSIEIINHDIGPGKSDIILGRTL